LLLQQLREELDKAFNTIRVVDSISKSSTPNDAKRFPQEYKRDGEGHKLLTIAVGTVPFFKNNAPISDVSQYANVLDWIFIMMYDTYVGKSVIGPNAPLQTSTQVGSNSQSFAQSWVAWTTAHMPAHKIVMGLPFYGYGAKPNEDAMKLKRLLVSAHPSKPQGDADDSLFASPCPGAKHAYSGMWKWRSLQNTGILTDANTPGGQWVKNWDQESQTPWLYNPLTHHLISYDDPDSIGLKVDFSKCKGAKGVGIWDLSFDMYNENKDGQLLSVVNAHLYNQSSTCQQLVTFPAYRSMGPHFNALSLQELNTQENGSNRCVPKYILLSLFILLFFSSR
jgi:chitinase